MLNRTVVITRFEKHRIRIRPVSDETSQLFVVHSNLKYDWTLTNSRIIKDDRISRVFELADGRFIKFVKKRTWHEVVRLFFFKSKITKELRSNVALAHMGFNVPVILEYGMALLPNQIWGVLGYYLMEPVKGDIAFERLPSLSDEGQKNFAENLKQDLKKLHKNQIVYNDLSLRNMFCTSEGDIYWIDTSIRKYPRQKNFIKNWDRSIAILRESLEQWQIPPLIQIEMAKLYHATIDD